MIVLFYYDTADVRRDSNNSNCSHKSGSGSSFTPKHILYWNFSLHTFRDLFILCQNYEHIPDMLLFTVLLFDGSIAGHCRQTVTLA